MVTVDQLNWKKFEDPNTPPMHCNMCDKLAPGSACGWLYANVAIAEDAEFMFVVCSKECKRMFRLHPMANSYIRSRIEQAKQMHTP